MFSSMYRQISPDQHDLSWDPRPHISYRQPGVPGDDHSDLPEFSFSHAVSSELRAHPEYIVLDLDLVRQMESTVTWWKKWLPIFLDGRNMWKHVETMDISWVKSSNCTDFSMDLMNPEAVSAFQEVLRLGKRWIF